MKIKLNRVPYLCPVMSDHTGAGAGHYIFNEKWAGVVIDLKVESEDDKFWRGKFTTKYENGEGWLEVELIKECFDICGE